MDTQHVGRKHPRRRTSYTAFNHATCATNFSPRNSDTGTNQVVVSGEEAVCSSRAFPSSPVSLLLSPDGEGRGRVQAAGSGDCLGAAHLACPLHPPLGDKSGETGLRDGLWGIHVLGGKDHPRCLYKTAQETMSVENMRFPSQI